MRLVALFAVVVLGAGSAMAQDAEPQFIHNGLYVEEVPSGAACTATEGRMRLLIDLRMIEEFEDEGAKVGEEYRGTVLFDDGAGRERRFEIDQALAGEMSFGRTVAMMGKRYFDGGLDSTERGLAKFQGLVEEGGDRIQFYEARWMDLGGDTETYIETVDAATADRSREDGSPVGDFVFCPDAEF